MKAKLFVALLCAVMRLTIGETPLSAPKANDHSVQQQHLNLNDNYTCLCHPFPLENATNNIRCDCTPKVWVATVRLSGLSRTLTTIPVPPENDALSLYDPFCIRLIPMPLMVTQPTFHVFTKTKEDQFKMITTGGAEAFVRKLDENGYFKKGRQVIFVVHGFFGNMCPSWMYELKNKILNAEDSTVFMVNWQLGADNPGYGIAASTTQTVAAAVAAVAEYVLSTNTFQGLKDGAYFYCVGHSLGGQVCGQAGRKARTPSGDQLFDRVTALDPAGPGFERCSDGLHVSKESAACVDVIHTDGSLRGHLTPLFHFGAMSQWGHIDFYPNGGSAQPSCGGLAANDQGCSHSISMDYFQSTITNPSLCSAVGPCLNGRDISGSCLDHTQNMGYWSSCHRSRLGERAEGVYYIDMGKPHNVNCTASNSLSCLNVDGAFFSIRSTLLGNTLSSGQSLVANASRVLPSIPRPSLNISKWLPG